MASLNLTPSLSQMLVQGAVIAAHYCLVKKLLVAPYLRVRAVRTALTSGARSAAVGLKAAVVARTSEIEAAVATVEAEIKELRKVALEAASTKRQEVIERSRQQARATQLAAASDLAASEQVLRAALPAVVERALGPATQAVVGS